MRLVMKFGGTCVGNGANIRRSAELAKTFKDEGNEVVAVVSAMAGVTDQLAQAARRASGGEASFIDGFIDGLEERHSKAIDEAIRSSDIKGAIWSSLVKELNELKKLLTVIAYLRELTPRSNDYVLSFGERLCAKVFTGSLKDLGVNAVYMTGWEAGIVTNSNHGEARPLMDLTVKRVNERISRLLAEGSLPVVTGFIAADEEGIVTTLGRGGSDYTATIIGASIKADEVIVWKDVDGIMTADPKLVTDAKPLPRISYEEATELAYFGAKVLHPLALEPLMEYGIPLRVKNFFNPKAAGTIIEGGAEGEGVVKAVTMIKDVAMLTISGAGMVEAPAFNAKVFKSLSDADVNPIMVSQGSSQASLSVVIPRKDLAKAIKHIKEALTPNLYKVEDEDDVCVVAVIGSGMRGTPGVAAKVFQAVAKKGINVRMIAQGSSELNISFVVKEGDGSKAVEAVHQEFELGFKPKSLMSTSKFPS
ncbi:MAG: aspartate kinase [Candidatus Nezhaarchaeales archaeon]